MKRFFYLNAITALYTIGLLVLAFIQMCVIATPIAYIITPGMEVNWLTFVIFVLVAIGTPFAYILSYKQIYSSFKKAWKNFHISVSFSKEDGDEKE